MKCNKYVLEMLLIMDWRDSLICISKILIRHTKCFFYKLKYILFNLLFIILYLSIDILIFLKYT